MRRVEVERGIHEDDPLRVDRGVGHVVVGMIVALALRHALIASCAVILWPVCVNGQAHQVETRADIERILRNFEC